MPSFTKFNTKKHACKDSVHIPASGVAEKYVVGIDDLTGWNFFKSNARVILQVFERTSDLRHFIDS